MKGKGFDGATNIILNKQYHCIMGIDSKNTFESYDEQYTKVITVGTF